MTGTPVESSLAFLPAGSTTTKGLAFVDRFNDGTGLAPMHAPINTSGARIDPATSQRQDAAAALLQSILSAVSATRAETVWTDDTGAFFLRVDTGTALTWLTPAGAASAGPGAGARPAAGPPILTDRAAYQAIASGTGFLSGDYLDHFVTADPSTGAVISNFWLNATQSTLIAAPPSASVAQAAPLPTGAAKDSTLSAIATVLSGTLKTATADVRATAQTLSAALGSFIDIPVNGQSIIGVKFAGLAASGATISYFSSNDATTAPASPIGALNASTGVTSTARTTDGETRIPVSGRTTLRLQVTTGGTGSVAVSWNISAAGTIVDIGSPLPPGANAIGSVTANLGTLNGAALDTSVQAVKTALGTPFQAGGAIGNTGFAINGTLPAFLATPTFNIGTAPTLTVQGAATVTQGPAGAAAWKVDGSGVTQPISGTVAATQGGSWTVSTTANGGGGSVTSVAAFSVLAGLTYTSTAPTVANGQQTGLQGDATANLYVSLARSTLPAFAATPTFILGAGSAKAGVFTTDQTTHGTTDKVAADLYVGGSAVGAANAVPVQAGYYIASLTAPASGSYGAPVIDKRSQWKISEAGSDDPLVGIAPAFTSVAAASQTIKSSAGNLYGLNVVSSATAGYIMLFDAAAVPVDGTVTPKWVMPLAANTGYSGSPSGTPIGMNFTTGIVAVFSSTGPFTKTASATAFISGSAR